MIKLISLFLVIVITYNGNYKPNLTWADFKVVKTLNDASAETTTEISYSYEETNGKVSIDVYCTMDKKQSFVVEGKQTPYLLNHEQRHFDISYYYAKLLHKRFNEAKSLTESKAKYTYNKTIIEWSGEQDLYDKETDHSINVKNQGLWDKKIDKLLNIK